MAKPILLIHGAWHASWCWQQVLPLLAGNQVISIDLPGHGGNKSNFRKISLTTYVDYVSQIIQELNTQVVLVGHSLAGVVISQLAENLPDLIDQLIYVAAFIPDNGGSLAQEAEKATTGIGTEMMIDLKKNAAELKKSQRVIDLFYNLCSPETIDFVKARLQPQPYRPLIDVIQLSEARFGKVKKVYIECSEDLAVTQQDQKRMYSKNPCQVISIKADHSPFLSAPAALAKAILDCLNNQV